MMMDLSMKGVFAMEQLNVEMLFLSNKMEPSTKGASKQIKPMDMEF